MVYWQAIGMIAAMSGFSFTCGSTGSGICRPAQLYLGLFPCHRGFSKFNSASGLTWDALFCFECRADSSIIVSDRWVPAIIVDCFRFKQPRKCPNLANSKLKFLRKLVNFLFAWQKPLALFKGDLKAPQLLGNDFLPLVTTCFLIEYTESTLNLYKGRNHISQHNSLRLSPGLRSKKISLGPSLL